MKLIDISTPKYPNTFTMVDDEDYDWLNQWKWCFGSRYVVRGKFENGRCRTIYMHLEILKPPSGMQGDHRFGDKLDHRRENLRICTNAENNRNKKPTPGRTLPKGVYQVSAKHGFRARIKLNYVLINLGYFATEAEAETAYIEAAKKYHGEFARIKPPMAKAS